MIPSNALQVLGPSCMTHPHSNKQASSNWCSTQVAH